MGAAQRVAARGGRERHPAARAAVVGVALLVGLSGTLSLTSARDHRQWVRDCEAAGGSVQSTPRYHGNPLIRETTDPVHRCLGPGGQVLDER